MGIIKQGILGGLSGKVGTVVGASWKGIQYLRSLPSSMSNPRTPAQQIYRKKMEMIVRFLKTCLNLIRIGFGSYAVKQSAFNAATSYNLRNAFTGLYPEVEIDYSKVLISMGNLQPATGVTAEALEPGIIDFSWNSNTEAESAAAGDVGLLLAYNPARGTSVHTVNGGTRDSGGSALVVPEEWAGETVHCYVTFHDFDRVVGNKPKDCISTSAYAGEVVVL